MKYQALAPGQKPDASELPIAQIKQPIDLVRK